MDGGGSGLGQVGTCVRVGGMRNYSLSYIARFLLVPYIFAIQYIISMTVLYNLFHRMRPSTRGAYTLANVFA